MSVIVNAGVSVSQFFYPEEQIAKCKEGLELLMVDSRGGGHVIAWIKTCFEQKVNSNLTFANIKIGKSAYRDVTIFQITYLYWKSFFMDWDPESNRQFEELINRMLEDENLNLQASFKDESTFDRHKEMMGFSIEEMTILHFAILVKDLCMMNKVFRIAPDLIHQPCRLIRNRLPIPDESTQPGICKVDIIANFTPLHLAAVFKDDKSIMFLIDREASDEVFDSSNHRPSYYMDKTTTDWVFPLLQPVSLKMPRMPQAICLLPTGSYYLYYDTEKKIARYAYEHLTKSSLTGVTTRKEISNTFKVDPRIPKEHRAQSKDYTNSGYERGHLRPAADATSSPEEMLDTFILTNICPQDPFLNKNHWKTLEDRIRASVQQNESLEVFTGAAFVPELDQSGKSWVRYQVIGGSNIAVPTHLFKVIYFNGTAANTAYLFPNQKILPEVPLETFLTTVDKIQSITGIMFKQWRT